MEALCAAGVAAQAEAAGALLATQQLGSLWKSRGLKARQVVWRQAAISMLPAAHAGCNPPTPRAVCVCVAAQAHSADLALALGKREIKFLVVTEDFGLVWRGSKFKLPTFALCTGGLVGSWHIFAWRAVARRGGGVE